MRHIDYLKSENVRQFAPGEKDLIARAQGRFYTHPVIGRHLASAVVRSWHLPEDRPAEIIDPFCGDGRLVCYLLEALSRSPASRRRHIWHIHLWDLDQDAVTHASRRVKAEARRRGYKIKLRRRCCDTFVRAGEHYGKFDVVLTNPPWDVLKPDRRELSSLGDSAASEYVESLRQQQASLERLFPLSKPSRRFSGWGFNLARCGTEAALRLLSPGGVLGVVSPASLLADQVSVGLRRWIVEDHKLHDIAFFPAEAKLFREVDQPSITLVASRPKTRHALRRTPLVSTYDRKRKVQSRQRISLPIALLRDIGYVVPFQLGPEAIRLFAGWRHLPAFSTLEGEEHGLYAGRELDETGYRSFLAARGRYAFLKGGMVDRFRIVSPPTLYVRPDGPGIPASANYPRLVWRDVSRPTQKRRLKATLIPAGWVTGNSLNIAYFRDHSMKRLKALLVLLNSVVFEFQARVLLSTAHVSLGSVRKVRLPWPNDNSTAATLGRFADRCLRGDTKALVDFEVFVAKLYGLCRAEFSRLLDQLPKISEQERDSLINSGRW